MSDENDTAPAPTPPPEEHSAQVPPPVKGGRPGPGKLVLLLAVVVALAVASRAGSAVGSATLFIVVITGLVLVHEAAHFMTARLFGIRVLEFGVGFPPRIGAVRWGEVEYSVNWLPLGGFVRLLGEEDPSDPRSLAAAAAWKRFIVLASGAVINLILPVLLFSIAFMLPHEESAARAVITEVVPGAPAALAGLEAGDVIYEIGGRDVKNVTETGRLVHLNQGREIDVRVRRAGEFVTVPVEPRWAPPEGEGPTGISIAAQYPFTDTIALPPWKAAGEGLQATIDSMILFRNEVIGWTKGSRVPPVAGPVGIAQTTGEVAREGGISPLLSLAAVLSINLGVLNLLPLPMLDGGRIFFLLIEVARRGKRVAPEREALVHLAGFVVFIGLAVVITFADIVRIANGESLFR